MLKKVYSIQELSSLLKGVIENHFTGIQVQAELSSVKRHSSGHLYFALKDEQAVIDGVCWKGVASRLAIQPQDGMEVLCTGRLTIYPGRSKYQIIVDSMELAGQGALLQKLEALKQKFISEGLFDPQHKKNIPYLPQRIGVITSPTGAVIRDILHRLDDRFPRPVTLWPVPVQGEGAAAKIAAAIHGFQNLPDEEKPDVIILARGGGSLEDLWCFNDELVVRAIFDCEIPLISAVGHETDTTLVDFVSDHRAPTPTAAAEKAVPVRHDLVTITQDRYRRMNQSMRRFFEDRSQRLDDYGDRHERATDVILNYAEQALARLKLRSPQDQIERQHDKVMSAERRLQQALISYVDRSHQRFSQADKLLESYSFKNTLKRGFALVKSESGNIIQSVSSLKAQQPLTIHLEDGCVTTEIKDVQTS